VDKGDVIEDLVWARSIDRMILSIEQALYTVGICRVSRGCTLMDCFLVIHDLTHFFQNKRDHIDRSGTRVEMQIWSLDTNELLGRLSDGVLVGSLLPSACVFLLGAEAEAQSAYGTVTE
jgi:hypothetical protein